MPALYQSRTATQAPVVSDLKLVGAPLPAFSRPGKRPLAEIRFQSLLCAGTFPIAGASD